MPSTFVFDVMWMRTILSSDSFSGCRPGRRSGSWLVVADGHPVRRQELDLDDLVLVLLERPDEVGRDLDPPVERQVAEDPDIIELPGARVADGHVHADRVPNLDLMIEIDGLDLDPGYAAG